jgi:ABC-type spermidine/putrescine transport system permease subunit I
MSVAAFPSSESRFLPIGRSFDAAAWLLVPAFVLVVLFFGLPALYLARMSFNYHPPGGFYESAWTLDNYLFLVSTPNYARAMGQTFLLSLVTATLTVGLAFIFAQRIWFASQRSRLFYVAIALCPLLISEVSIIFGWIIFLPRNGLLSFALTSLGLIDEKINLLYTLTAAILGLVYISFPYCVFIFLSVFQGIDRRLLEASADLGSSPIRTFRTVLFPLTRGGFFVAFSQSFIWSVGTYATPSALGPDWLWSIGGETYRQMASLRNWPFAAVLSIVVVLLILLSMIAAHHLDQPKGTSDEQ